MTFFKIILVIFAFILILVGVVTAITPVPFGLPLIIIGFLMLATISPATLRFIRRRWGWLNRRLKWLQKKLPRWMTRSLRKSDPFPEDEDKNDGGEDAPDDGETRDDSRLADILRRRA